MENTAIVDLYDGLKRWYAIYIIAINEIKQKYRRTALGPLWNSINMIVMVLGLSLLFGTIFKQNVKTYVSYLAVGILFWTYITSVVTDSCRCWTDSSEIIKQIKVPLSFFTYKLMIKNLILLIHNTLIVMLVLTLLGEAHFKTNAQGVMQFIIAIIGLFSISILIAMLTTRYRDVLPIVENGLQLIFYLTPIIWKVQQVGEGTVLNKIIRWNPFFYEMTALRGILDGSLLERDQMIVFSLGVLVLISFSFMEFNKHFKKLAYWL